MRTLILATGLAALAAFPALAQTGGSRNTISATGTNGSTVTTANTTTAGTTTANTAGNANTTSSAFSVQALPPSSGGTSTSSAPGGANTLSNVTTDTTAASNPGSAFRQGGPFSNDSGNRALGLSPGQSSSGTLAGNSSAGIGNVGEPVDVGIVGTLVPEGNVSIIGGGGSTGFAGSAVQQQAAPATQVQTPLFDQVAREGLAKEQRRRARGDEPRIIGIAPRTDADLSWQMPDDKIIRY